MNTAVALRHALHTHPELSGSEVATAERLLAYFTALSPDETITGLGGTGVAFAFGEKGRGPTILLRSELDALPIQESNAMPYRSQVEGVSHKCGHDGHMAILAAVGSELARRRPRRGRVVLLFQPAEETGDGACAVVADARYRKLQPERVFGLHNVPGYPLGQLLVRAGTFTCASRGMRATFRGKSAHAAQPETGISPAIAVANTIRMLGELAGESGPANELKLATVVGATMGGRNFGVVPDRAEVCATLRCEKDSTMAELVAACEQQVRRIAAADGLETEISYQDIFDATVNAPDAVAAIVDACAGLPLTQVSEPFRWSEDFGRYTQVCNGAFFGLGAGEDQPDLHNDDYDFPDELVEAGADAFLRIVRHCLGESQ